MGLLTPLSGCDLVADPHGGLLDEIEENRRRWAQARPDRYVYTLRNRCFCGREAIGPARIEVEGATVVGQVYTESGEAVDPDVRELFPPVEGLFELLEEAATSGADDIQVTFDPTLGIPTDVFIDADENTVDEERGYQVLALPTAVHGG